MKKKTVILASALLLLFCGLPLKQSAAAFSAPYPTLILIVENAPKEISFSLTSGKELKWERRDVIWAKYCTLYLKDYNMETIIKVSDGKQSFNITVYENLLSAPLNYATLDFDTQTIFPKKTFKHNILCIVPVMIFVLLLECTIFYFWGHRKKKSWFALLLITLVANGVINAWVYSSFPSISIMVFTRIATEIIVSPLKILAIILLIREHELRKRIGYAIAADVSNLCLEILLLNILPI